MAAKSSRSSKPGRRAAAEKDVSEVRERILETFSAKARRSGIRSVLMGELASELRMSAMTLYKHFASKDELVNAMVDAWVVELSAVDALDWEEARTCDSALQALLKWADAWTASLSVVSPAFFEDLRRDHRDAWKRFNKQIRRRKRAAAEYLTPFLREDVHAGAMMQMLDDLVMKAADVEATERLGISRREAVRAALSVWGGGALRRRANLRSL